MPVRPPAVAGLFYPGEPRRCKAEAEHYLSMATSEPSGAPQPGTRVLGGIAPHAGWAYSGAVAARTLGCARAEPEVETFVVFGAVHRPRGRAAAVYGSGSWLTPLGEIEIDEELARAVIEASPLLVEDLAAHGPEHSIEVEVPFLQALTARARLLPIMVPPTEQAPEVGRIVAREASRLGRRVMFFGSSDLTHYGPRYEFMPAGYGAKGIRWAKEVNDRQLLDVVTSMDAERVVPTAREHQSACGPGAIAATMAACAEAGARQGTVLEHTNSSEVIGEPAREMSDAVGYAAVVFT